MKSVCCSGRKLSCSACRAGSLAPEHPGADHDLDWMTWQLAPSGSISGERNVITRCCW
jgi:hypothetical protein